MSLSSCVGVFGTLIFCSVLIQCESPEQANASSKVDNLQSLLEGKAGSEVVREFLNFVQQGDNQLVPTLELDAPDRIVEACLRVGAVNALTDLVSVRVLDAHRSELHIPAEISTVGESNVVTWATRSIAVLCRSSKTCREDAKKAGTVTILLRAVKKGSGLDQIPRVTSAVAEALCALVFANKDNHLEAVRRGAVASMMGMALRSESAVTSMWALAALHALAEDSCASSTGRCPWVGVAYQAQGVEPDRRGHSDLNARLAVDSSDVRLTMNTLGLIPQVVDLVVIGPPTLCPGNLTTEHAERLPDNQRLSGWAAAALLKSIALSPPLQLRIVAAGGVRALGKMRKSDCTLEKREAEGALERILSVAKTREHFSPADWEAVWGEAGSAQDSSASTAIGGSRWRDQIVREEL